MPKKISLKNCYLYLFFTLLFCLFHLWQPTIPLALPLAFSLMVCGSNLWLTTLLYLLSALVHRQWLCLVLALFEGGFCALLVFAYRKTERKMSYEAVAYLLLCLLPFLVFGSFEGELFDNPWLMRGACCLLLLFFYPFCLQFCYTIIYRLARCRLKEEEWLAFAIVGVVAACGLFALLGDYYLPLACVGCLLYARLTHSPSTMVVAFLLLCPFALHDLSLTPFSFSILLGVTCLLLCKHGKVMLPLLCTLLAGGFLYLRGFFDGSITLILLKSAVLAFMLLACLPTDEGLKNLHNRLHVVERLEKSQLTLCRREAGERLFKISEVFREIQIALNRLDEGVGDDEMKKHTIQKLRNLCCKGCERKERCEQGHVGIGFIRLTDSGFAKGKVNLIDLPRELTQNCNKASELIVQLNGLLAEAKRKSVELENAKAGRKLLGEQALGVANVLKGCALDLYREDSLSHSHSERLKKLLAEEGIACPELSLQGEEGEEVLLLLTGNPNLSHVGKLLGDKVLKDKMILDDHTAFYRFVPPPKFDAVFGVATRSKEGETCSGDTHSVIRINEHSFLMVLSDGMGSGEYANRISDTAISLIEAFYRAEMPKESVLDTINQLISLGREERFACIDIAYVDLNNALANFIKIGAPLAVIARQNELKVLEGQSLPLGILDDLHPSTCTEQLKEGDFVLFMSDGITSAFATHSDLFAFLQTLTPLQPQNYANQLLFEALRRTGGRATDDMTVLCTRLYALPYKM